MEELKDKKDVNLPLVNVKVGKGDKEAKLTLRVSALDTIKDNSEFATKVAKTFGSIIYGIFGKLDIKNNDKNVLIQPLFGMPMMIEPNSYSRVTASKRAERLLQFNKKESDLWNKIEKKLGGIMNQIARTEDQGIELFVHKNKNPLDFAKKLLVFQALYSHRCCYQNETTGSSCTVRSLQILLLL